MSDSTIQLPPDSTGKKIDTEQLTVGANTVQRERGQIAGATALAIASVLDAPPGAGVFALAVRQVGAVTVNIGLTNAELRAAPIPVSGTVAVNIGLTDTQLRATPIPVSGTVAVNIGLTDTQLRASPVPVKQTSPTRVRANITVLGAAPMLLLAHDTGGKRVVITDIITTNNAVPTDTIKILDGLIAVMTLPQKSAEPTVAIGMTTGFQNTGTNDWFAQGSGASSSFDVTVAGYLE